MNWMPGRFIMAAIGLYVVWTLVRAWKTGKIRDSIYTFDIDDNPIMYPAAFASHILIVAICFAGLAGYSPAQFLDMVGLGSFNSFFNYVHSYRN